MPSSPSVLHLTRSAWPVAGGMEASIEGLARAQVDGGWRVRVACLRGADRDAHGVERARLERCGPTRYPRARSLDLEGFDIVHVHGIDGLADQVVGRHPAVGISTHGGYFHTDRHRWVKELVLRTWTRRTLARAGAVWFSSASDRDRLGGGEGWVLGDGISASTLARRPVPGRWVVPGRVDVHKGVDDLLDLLQDADARRGLRELRVVGPIVDPALSKALRQRARGLPVCFTGWVDGESWRRELAAADVALFPSRYEGFGIAAVEAMAAGIPVVLADIPAFREHLGGRGVDVRGRDVSGFRRALLEGGRRTAERASAMERHHWPRVAARYLEAYERLLGGPCPAS